MCIGLYGSLVVKIAVEIIYFILSNNILHRSSLAYSVLHTFTVRYLFKETNNSERLWNIFLTPFSLFHATCIQTAIEKSYCSSNAARITDTDHATICDAQAALMPLCLNGTASCWFMICLELFIKRVIRYNNVKYFKMFQIGFILVIPLTFFGYGLSASRGFTSSSPICSIRHPQDLYALKYPLFCMLCIGAGLMAIVVVHSLIGLFWRRKRVALSDSASNLIDGNINQVHVDFISQRNDSDRNEFCDIIFIAQFFITVFAVVYGMYVIDQTRSKTTDNVTVYTKCVFKNYDGSDSYLNVCGTSPKKESSIAYNFLYGAALCGAQSIVIAGTYTLKLFLGKKSSSRSSVVYAEEKKNVPEDCPQEHEAIA